MHAVVVSQPYDVVTTIFYIAAYKPTRCDTMLNAMQSTNTIQSVICFNVYKLC